MAPAVAQLPTPVASPHSSLVDEKPASRRVSQLSSSSSRRSSRASKTSSIILQGHHELVSTWVEKPDGTRVLQRRIVLHDSPTSAPATATAIAPAAEPVNDAEPSLAAPSPRSSMDLRRASTIMPNVINVMAATMPPTTFLSGYQSSMPYDTAISPFAPPMPRRGSSESALTVTKAADAPKYPKDPKSIHALPAHRREACSPLAPEADLQSYRGLMNVAALTLVVSNLRLIIENFLSWGLLLTLPRNWVGTQDWVVGAACIAFLGCVAAFSYSIEKTSATAGACFFVIESPMRRWALINLIAALVVPTCFVWFAVRDPVTGTAVMALSVIVVLKLTSYHLVNAELRYFYNYGHVVPTYASKSDDDRAIYPRNITVGNLVNFLSFPTLCYQPKYPRTDKVHVGKVIKYALETAVAIIIMYSLVEQYMRPIVESTYAALTDPVTGDVHWTNASPVFLLERTLTLTLTTIYFWLTMFFGLFHAASNLQAELTRFADREFYLDWWNCSTIGSYWRLWNQPVHTWLKRHIYIPLVAGKWLPDPHHPPGALPDSPRGEIVGVSKQTAGLVCFFVSAVFHELLIAVPTKLVWMVGFGAMIVQVPLMAVSETWDKKYRQWKPDGVNMLGNLLMWVTFCLIGHPTAVMLYYVKKPARSMPVTRAAKRKERKEAESTTAASNAPVTTMETNPSPTVPAAPTPVIAKTHDFTTLAQLVADAHAAVPTRVMTWATRAIHAADLLVNRFAVLSVANDDEDGDSATDEADEVVEPARDSDMLLTSTTSSTTSRVTYEPEQDAIALLFIMWPEFLQLSKMRGYIRTTWIECVQGQVELIMASLFTNTALDAVRVTLVQAG
ncbi:hypothetical protein GGF31_002774 [Allomyces arbusculus]|nr:hypothetical protein GGF31_002774 [Allomyces arbusculus]